MGAICFYVQKVEYPAIGAEHTAPASAKLGSSGVVITCSVCFHSAPVCTSLGDDGIVVVDGKHSYSAPDNAKLGGNGVGIT